MENTNSQHGFDDLVFASDGSVNQCTPALIATTLQSYWQGLANTKTYSIIEWMVDTGCATIVAQSGIANKWLQDKKKSNMVMSGFSTASTEAADLTGSLHCFVLCVAPSSPMAITSNDTDSLPNCGVPITIEQVNTTDMTRHNLMGLGFFGKRGYRVTEGFTGLSKTDKLTGVVTFIPFYHVPETSSWHMLTVVANSLAEAEEAGHSIELVYPRLTSEGARTALAFDRHCTKIMQVCGGLLHMHYNDEQYLVNVDYINAATNFDKMNASTYLSPGDFNKWISTMINESTKISTCDTFDGMVESYPVSAYELDTLHLPSPPSVLPMELSDMEGYTDLFVPAEDDHVMGGIKKFVHQGKKTASLKFHSSKGHGGYHPDCQVCRYLRYRFSKTFTQIDRYIDPRPCILFNMDILTISHRSDRGNKYAVILKCPAVGFNELILLEFKSDFIGEWCRMVDARRADPRFQYSKHMYMMNVHTDCDGAWDNRSKAAVAAREKRGIGFILASPEDSNKNARGEKMIQDAERGMKALMIEHRIAIQHWDYALQSSLDSKNLFPLSKNMISKDGDAPLPWTEATNGIVSRGMALEALGKFVACGTFAALGNSKILASNIVTPIRQGFGICMGVIGICQSNLVFWLDLHTGAFVRTNDFKVITLPIGMSPYQYFGLASPPLSKRAMPIADDYQPQVKEIIQIEGIGAPDTEGLAHAQQTLRDLGDLPHPRAVVLDEEQHVVIRGQDGIWVRTGEAVSQRDPDVLQESLKIPKLKLKDAEQNIIDKITANPLAMISKSVYRRFNSEGVGYKVGTDDNSSNDLVAHGVIKSFWLENGAHRWRILYDDKHVEDYDIDELMEFAINKKSGSVSTTPTTGPTCIDSTPASNHNPWVAVKPARGRKDVAVRQLPIDHKALMDDIISAPKYSGCHCGCSSSVIISVANESFRELCRRIPGLGNNETSYYTFLQNQHNYGHERITGPGYTFADPFNKRTSSASRQLPPGIPFPIPSGSFIGNTDIVNAVTHKLNSDALNPDFQATRLSIESFEYAQALVLCSESSRPDLVYRDVLNDDDRDDLDFGIRQTDNISPDRVRYANLIEASELDLVPKAIFCKHPKEIPKNALTGRLLNPRNWNESQLRADHALFEQAYYKELFNFKRKEVLILGFTHAKFIELGILAKPIPLSALFEIKWANGVIDKYKVRIVALGHPGNVQPGVHWQGSKYAATPSLDSARVFVALTVFCNWEVKYFDAITAFLNGGVKDTEKIPVRFPPELRTYDSDGNEMYALLNKALYGHPIASLRWSQTRDDFTLKFFNENGWGCVKIIDYEPCMFVMLSPAGSRIIFITHTDDFRIAGDKESDVDYVIDQFNREFGVTPVTTGVMLGVEIKSGTDANGIRFTELTQTNYIEMTHAECNRFMKPNYHVNCPIAKEKAKTLIHRNDDGTILKPPIEEYTKNLDKGYRTVVGMLLWIQRNTKVGISTSMAYLCRVMATPSDLAFECMLQVVQWVYQERLTGLRFSSDNDIVPYAWYDASNDRDLEDSLCIGGGMTMMMGASVQYHANKLKHVGSAGSSENEYMELERTTRRVIWLRNMLIAMQIFRTTNLSTGDLNYGKTTRLFNRTPTYVNQLTGRMLTWICVHDGHDYNGKWAIIDELGTADIQAIAESVSERGQHGPAADTIWMIPAGKDSNSNVILTVDSSITVLDIIETAAIVKSPTIIIGDNITALKWASVDAVTPGNAHIKAAYHWLKDTVRELEIDLRDIPSALNLADYLTKVVMGPAMRSSSDAASGYTKPPDIPSALKYL